MSGDPDDPRFGAHPYAADAAGEDDVDETDAWIDALEDAMRERGRPSADLSGLSPRQAARLVHRPLDADDVAVFADAVPTPEGVPVVHLVAPLLAAAADGPLRLTRHGYLPGPLARRIGAAFQERFGATAFDPLPTVVRGERDLRALNVARRTAECAGLLRRVGNDLRTTRAGRAALERSGPSPLLPRLLRAFYRHADAWEAVHGHVGPCVREGTGLTVYLLTRYGARPRPARFYAERLLRAHPDAEHWFGPVRGSGAARQRTLVDLCATTLLFRLAWTFGFASSPEGEERPDAFARPAERPLVRTPLLAAMIAFPVGAGADDAHRGTA